MPKPEKPIILRTIEEQGIDLSTIPSLTDLGFTKTPSLKNQKEKDIYAAQVATKIANRINECEEKFEKEIKNILIEELRKNPDFQLNDDNMKALFKKHEQKLTTLYQQSQLNFVPIHFAYLRQEMAQKYDLKFRIGQKSQIVKKIKEAGIESGKELQDSALRRFKGDCTSLFDKAKEAAQKPEEEKKDSDKEPEPHRLQIKPPKRSSLSYFAHDLEAGVSQTLSSLNKTSQKLNNKLRSLTEPPLVKPRANTIHTSKPTELERTVGTLYAQSQSRPSTKTTTVTSTSSSALPSPVVSGFDLQRQKARSVSAPTTASPNTDPKKPKKPT
ncbi:MAG: hypothetical protein JSR17_13470 [Proteobacteria bacterium]|nr:hypothetical protein [Pseudomonadota bacterium]